MSRTTRAVCVVIVLILTYITYNDVSFYHVKRQPQIFMVPLVPQKTSCDVPLLVFSEQFVFPPGNGSLTAIKSSNRTKKLIVWLNVPEWENIGMSFPACSMSDCVMSTDSSLVEKADAVIAHGVNMPKNDVPRTNSSQIWIFYGMESPLHYNNVYQQSNWLGRFNWTMTYRLDSDIPKPYGYFVQLGNSSRSNQSEEDFLKISREKTSPIAWFVSNCNAPSKRLRYVDELKKFISVDIFGSCGTKVCPRSRSLDCLRLLNTTYKFYLSFENSLCTDYVTEKLFLVYSTTAVPIVRGGANYSKLLPPGTYINTDWFASPKQLADYLNYLHRHNSEYVKFLKAKQMYRYISPTVPGPLNMYCTICERLHENVTISRKTYSDMSTWLNKDMCHSPNDIPT